jgi:hypothetical protein
MEMLPTRQYCSLPLYINRLSSLFTLRRSIPTAMMPGLYFLFVWFFLSERLVLWCSTDFGFMECECFPHDNTVLFHYTSTVYPHSLRFAGLFLRRAMPLSLYFYPFGSFSPRDWIYDVRQKLRGMELLILVLWCSTDFGVYGMGMLPTR